MEQLTKVQRATLVILHDRTMRAALDPQALDQLERAMWAEIPSEHWPKNLYRCHKGHCLCSSYDGGSCFSPEVAS